jgi:hypothetical protein
LTKLNIALIGTLFERMLFEGKHQVGPSLKEQRFSFKTMFKGTTSNFQRNVSRWIDHVRPIRCATNIYNEN